MTAIAAAAISAASPSRQLKVLSVLFFFSGFPALMYQLVWQRALFRIFGVNIESVTIVVTAFMLGLGLGGLAGGWLSKRAGLPLLLLLAAIEALTGLFGLFSLTIFESVGDAVLGVSLPLTALTTLALVVVPTLLMGATLPLLVGHLVRRTGNVGEAVGQMYHVNTLGAGAACLACAVLFFPWLGMRGTVYLAVALNLAVALAAVFAHLLDRRRAVGRNAADVSGPGRPSAPTQLPFHLVLVMAAAVGLVSLSYEIFFFRVVSYATGSSAFAFAATLGAFLVGLASGARVSAEACARLSPHQLLRRMTTSLLLASVLGAAFLPVLSRFAWLDRAVLGVALLFVYLLARQWGLLLPSLAHLGVPADHRAGQRTGALYLANIVGAATGSVVTGFVLMDHFGIVAIAQGLVAAGAACALALGLTLREERRVRFARAAAVVAAAAVVVLAVPSMTGPVLESLQWKGAAGEKGRFTHVIENRSGIITVDADGTVFGGGAYDGHFNTDPVNDVNGIVRPYALSLFHPAPRDVLMIGLASGSWAQVVANNPEVRELTIVEINPGYSELVEAHPAVASLLSNPKVRLVTDDGRRWLRMNPARRFDAIVMNTTFHHRANATNLLSAEFLQGLRPHLNVGGVLFYNTTESARVQRTGCEVFPLGARFMNHMVLSDTPIAWDFDRWVRSVLATRIDGRPVIDPSQPDHAAVLAGWRAAEPMTRPGHVASGAGVIELCGPLLARTPDMRTVTDDNMGNEWTLIPTAN